MEVVLYLRLGDTSQLDLAHTLGDDSPSPKVFLRERDALPPGSTPVDGSVWSVPILWGPAPLSDSLPLSDPLQAGMCLPSAPLPPSALHLSISIGGVLFPGLSTDDSLRIPDLCWQEPRQGEPSRAASQSASFRVGRSAPALSPHVGSPPAQSLCSLQAGHPSTALATVIWATVRSPPRRTRKCLPESCIHFLIRRSLSDYLTDEIAWPTLPQIRVRRLLKLSLR